MPGQARQRAARRRLCPECAIATLTTFLVQLASPFATYAHGPVHEQLAAVNVRVTQAPNDTALLLQRAELYRVDQNFTAALADYARVGALPDPPTTLGYFRGRALFEAGRHGEALKDLNQFIAAYPTFADAHLIRAHVLEHAGKPAAAAADYERALATLRSPEPDHYVQYARALVATGPRGITRGLAVLDEGMRKLGPIISLNLIALDIEIAGRRFCQALTRIDRLADKSPRKENWYKRRADVLLLAGRKREAHDTYRKALQDFEKLPAATQQIPAMTALKADLHRALGR